MSYKIGKISYENGLIDYLITNNELPNDYVLLDYTVDNILTTCRNTLKDYKFTRARLQDVALQWETLTQNEKMIIAQYRATSEENCKLILGNNYGQWSTNFGLLSKDCRERRFEHAKTILIQNISVSDRYMVLGFLSTTKLEENYIKHGLEGTNDTDPVSGLFDWIESTDDYIGTGLSSMNLTIINGITQSEMIIKIMDCLRNGEY